jgi:hypothetical protein
MGRYGVRQVQDVKGQCATNTLPIGKPNWQTKLADHTTTLGMGKLVRCAGTAWLQNKKPPWKAAFVGSWRLVFVRKSVVAGARFELATFGL